MTCVDNDLKCNELKCRASLWMQKQAVVTTCSHIFCVTCANHHFSQSRACPACKQDLPAENDIVSTWLDPEASYKATILSGLTPVLVCEIARRSLDFWVYQTSQETEYQSMLQKQAQSKVDELRENAQTMNLHLQRAQKEAKEAAVQLDIEKRRSYEFEQALRLKDAELTKLKGIKDTMMKQAIINNAQHEREPSIASDARDRLAARHTRLTAGTPLADQRPRPFQPTPLHARTSNPVFYPKLSSSTATYSRPGMGFQLHQPAATHAPQARGRGSVSHRHGRMESVQGSEVDSRDDMRRGRQTAGPGY